MRILFLFILSMSFTVKAADHHVSGIVEVRAFAASTSDSYLEGGLGKFRFSDGHGVALSQAGLSWHADLNDSLSMHMTGNAYADGDGVDAGLTELYLGYRSLPSTSGYRVQARAGIVYPKVSMENFQVAWTSPYTLTFSTANNWLGEEVRHQGIDFSVTRLGRFGGSEHDFSLGASLYLGNDPTGAMLAWHGWTLGSRQSFHNEMLELPDLPAGFIPDASDAFLELDDRFGYHLYGEWDWLSRARILLGYYDNNADPRVVENLQWAWETRFSHIGLKWVLGDELELIAQYLGGNTRMQSGFTEMMLVDNDFSSGFLMLSYRRGAHRLTMRMEAFDVDDLDTIQSDPNSEHGQAVTFGYQYRLSRNWFVLGEFNRIDSNRPARELFLSPQKESEKLYQLALRYMF